MKRILLLTGLAIVAFAQNEYLERWNSELANIAQRWANTCREGHNPRRSSNSREFSSVGENIYRRTDQAHAVDVVKAWYSEKRLYDFGSNSCSGVCGHYTQVVWADSEALGCGVAYCSNLFGGRGGYNYVCNYGPAGNWNGQRPYVTGRQCSRCSRGYNRCYSGLCSNKPGDNSYTPPPTTQSE